MKAGAEILMQLVEQSLQLESVSKEASSSFTSLYLFHSEQGLRNVQKLLI
jgi:hypothetical protein